MKFPACIAVMLAFPVLGQEVTTRPALAGRVVRVFDFEEEATNPGEVPRDWYRAQDNPAGERRPAYPEWNKARIIYGEGAYAGRGAVVLPVRGGCSSLVLGEGVAPVFEDAEYMVTAKVRTRNLRHAAARLSAQLLDTANRPLPGGWVVGAPVRSEEAWIDTSVTLPAGAPGAAFIRVELEALQPEQMHEGPTPPLHLWKQDYDGEVWFDEVTITQPPRTDLSTPYAGNIIPADATPEVRASVRDMTGQPLIARFTVHDIRGEAVARDERPIGGAVTTASWRPILPRYGWYRVRMDLYTSGSRVGGALTDLLWLCPLEAPSPGAKSASPDSARFGVVLDSAHDNEAVRSAIRELGAGAVTVPIGDGTNPGIVPMIDSLLSERRDVTLCFTDVPGSLAESAALRDRQAWSMLLLDKDAWLPLLGDVLDRYGQRVQRWQVGSWKESEGAAWRSRVWREADAIRASLATLVAGPVVRVPMRADAPRPVPGIDRGGAVLAVADVVSGTAGTEGFVGAWHESHAPDPAPEATLMLPLMPWERFGIAAGPEAAARNAAAFWASISRPDGSLLPGASIAIEQPWTTAPKTGIAQVSPRPELAAWRTVAAHLRDRRAVARFPVSDGVVCWILAPSPDAAPGRTGALVAWNEWASPEEAVVRGFLGPGPIRLTDIYGNTTPAPADSDSDTGGVRIPLDGSPVFIEGIDLSFARFLAGFRVEPALLESNNKSHPREAVIVNPWGQTLTGRLTILEPGGFENGRHDRSWRISPRVMKFAIPPGKAERVPFSVSFSPSEEVGPKEFVFNVELVADEVYQPVIVRRRLEVGLADLTLDVSYFTRGERGQDLVIEAAVSNSGSRALTLDLTAFAPDLPRAKTTIVDLAGGNQAVRRMTFAGGAARTAGKRIVVSVRDTSSEARITKSIEVR